MLYSQFLTFHWKLLIESVLNMQELLFNILNLLLFDVVLVTIAVVVDVAKATQLYRCV